MGRKGSPGLHVPRTIAGVALAGSVIVWPARASAQGTLSAGCQTASVLYQDACQKTVDVFAYLAPQLATAIAGGNATLGQGGTLGGLGHFTIGVRANAVDGDVPKIDNTAISTTGAVADTLAVKRVAVPMVTADLGIGLFKGLPLGVTRVLGVDALVSALYVPTYNSNSVDVRPDHPLKLGLGGRLGILGESGFLPGISFTYLVRDLPQTSIIATSGTDSLRVQNLDVSTRAWRVVAGKHLLFLGIAAGVGQDHYRASTSVGAEVNGFSSAGSLASPSLSLTRTNYFGDLSYNLPVVTIAAEVGRIAGGVLPTYNAFAGKPAGAGRLYGSAGVRIRI